ncbi:hypothetical protein BCR39DRAFT_497297 [Naematelia encephala]|uniref:Peptidase S9 prolyl oligopeptidase catalytic domain-containing protein n=1 Tax=Naematelia encephala TaxID=71784 RepID=A0A1Y2AY47_9TREE|nr:hypothetical protein BCR39DRAFT_497297 [Naematelia encephala]
MNGDLPIHNPNLRNETSSNCCNGHKPEHRIAFLSKREACPDHRSRDRSCRDQVTELVKTLSQLDVLINCAGVVIPDPPSSHLTPVADLQSALLASPASTWSTTFSVNVESVYFLSVSVLHLLAASPTKGRIINISSIGSTMADPNVSQPAYQASKAAVNHLTRLLASKFRETGIRVNAISPVTEMLWATLLLGVTSVAWAKPLSQKPFDSLSPLEESAQLGLPWQEVVAIPQIDSWALNPSGDAAVLRIATLDPVQDKTSHELHLLAINAQYPIPPIVAESTHPGALFTFLEDDVFATLTPTDGSWQLATRQLNYSSAQGAHPPSLGGSVEVTKLAIAGQPTQIVYSAKAGILSIVVQGGQPDEALLAVKLKQKGDLWKAAEIRRPLADLNLVVEEIAAGEHQFAVVVSDANRPWNSTRTDLYLVDLSSDNAPEHLTRGEHGTVRSPSFAPGGQVAWLQQRQDGNARDMRRPWLYDQGHAWEIDTGDWDLTAEKILFSKDGSALNLLVFHEQVQSFWHIWTPKPTSGPSTPVRIPSSGTVHDAIHIGVTASNHSHFIGIKSSLVSSHNLWVVSHSPFSDPTDNFEEVRLTWFGNATETRRTLSAGQLFEYGNDQGAIIKGRIFLPTEAKQRKVPAMVYIHGDEDGGGWHDWWMRHWNPNAFLVEGWAVITINPTGSEGYGQDFIDARRFQWGNQTMTDLRLGLEHVLEAYPIDQDSLFGLGYGAYGGFGIHWMQGHPEDFHFKGFNSHNGILSPRWWAYESSAPSKANWQFGPASYAANSPYTLWDPERFVEKWQTPELIITDGADDADTGPPSQSKATFQVLQG